MSLYRQTIHGLTLLSEIPLSEPGGASEETTGERVDVEVRLGFVPERLDDPQVIRPTYQIAAPGSPSQRLLVTVPGVARYLLEGSDRVTIDTTIPPESPDLQAVLVGAVLSLATNLHGRLPLHASAVRIDGGAFVFAGPTTVGKSTMAAAFAERGYPVICDDVCVVEIVGDVDGDGVPTVVPSTPAVKLWGDVVESLGRTATARAPVGRMMKKHGISYGSVASPVPLRRFYRLDVQKHGEAFEVSPFDRLEAVYQIQDNVHRRRIARDLGLDRQNFRIAGRVASNVRSARLSVARDIEALDALVDRVLADD